MVERGKIPMKTVELIKQTITLPKMSETEKMPQICAINRLTCRSIERNPQIVRISRKNSNAQYYLK
jgi:hypothetical protein